MQSFAQLDLANVEAVEFVVVANACTDDSVKVLQEFEKVLPLKIVVENRLGVAHGRNAVVDNSTGDAILWTDDDITVGPEWASTYVRLFEEHRDVDFFGGPIEPRFEGNRVPSWIDTALRHVPSSYAKLNLDPKSRPFVADSQEEPYGANMAIRSRVLGRTPFDPSLGRVGHNQLSGGEETRLIRNLVSAGHVGWWVNSPCVSHWIDESRQTVEYLKNYWFHVGCDEFGIFSPDQRAERLAIPLWVRRWRKLKFWAKFQMAFLKDHPDEWVPALREHQLERGRLHFVSSIGVADQSPETSGQWIK